MSDKPLFQGMDEKERELAPQQVPGAAMPPEERDVGGTAGQGTAHAADAEMHEADTGAGQANIAGAEGDQRTAPVVAVRPDMSAHTPIMTPVTDDQQRLPEGDTSADRTRA